MLTKKLTLNNYFVIWLGFSALTILLTLFVSQYYNFPDFLPDKGASWYYWQLPEVNNIARLTGWSFFLLHLVTTIALVWKIQKDKSTEVFSYWQKALLFSQMFFILLHLAQTYFWYDSLVKDTPVWLSQFSVIIMLVLMLGILNQKRGLFFGRKVPLPSSITKAFIDFHGYFIILATVFTFWYHPMEATVGHLIGFFYMFMLLGQIIFSNTSVHFNRNWVFLLEITVLIHGTAIAMQNINNPSLSEPKVIWPMFAFGFATIAVITQIYYLKLSKKIIILINILYLAALLAIYSGALFGIRSFNKIYEISFIPFIEYLLVFVFAGIAWIYIKLLQKSK